MNFYIHWVLLSGIMHISLFIEKKYTVFLHVIPYAFASLVIKAIFSSITVCNIVFISSVLGVSQSFQHFYSCTKFYFSRSPILSQSSTHHWFIDQTWVLCDRHCFRVACAAHKTAHSTPTSSCTNSNVIVSMAGKPVLRRWQDMFRWIKFLPPKRHNTI